MKQFVLLSILLLLANATFGQGTSTSSIIGRVTDGSETLIGATVVAVHQPSGTTYGTSTDENGNFRIPGMRVGGPYRINISYIGFEEATYDNIYLALGQPCKLEVQVREFVVTMGMVIVEAQAGSAGGNIGASTVIKGADLEQMPTLSRNLSDYTRLTPQAKTTFGGGSSIAGINNRYNAIYIDGAVNNDVFGLSASGTNGGQTGIAPISIDAIEQIQVVVSPYDVTLGGFAGGGINAVTKSGTNEFKGSAYYFNQHEGLAGNTNSRLLERTGDEAAPLDEFSQKLYGLSLGGKLATDKVFFFLNGEIQRDETPLPFDIATYQGNSSEGQLKELRDFLINTYDYDPGGFGSKTDRLRGTRIFGKLDFNLNKASNLTLRHQYTKAEQFDANASSDRFINYDNNGIYFPSTTNSFAAELNSIFGSKASNNLIVGVTTVRDDRDPIGDDFPFLIFFDGPSRISLGSEQFSMANIVEQDVYTFTNNFKLFTGNHTITIGTHNEWSKFNNLFIRQNYGVYEFNSIADFLNGENANLFYRSYSLVDDEIGDASAAASNFGALQLGFYLQDEWVASNKFTLTYGLRLDMPVILDDPAIAEDFNTTTLPLLADSYDLQGAQGGLMPERQLLFSPRLGLEFKASSKTQFRAGAGVFTSRIPFVWPGGAFNNNGLTIGGVLLTNQPFEPNIEQQPTDPNFAIPSGQIDLFSENFKYPQVLRASAAIDQVLPAKIKISLEGIFTKTLNNVLYTNVNSDPTEAFRWTGGPDERAIYSGQSLDPTYTAVYLATNTSEGSGLNLTASLNKDFSWGLNAFAAYTYGEAESLIDGTSSQNSSQWRGGFNVDGRNMPEFGISDFALGSRFIAALGYRKNWGWGDRYRTSVSLFYNRQSGDPYSYVYAGSAARNLNNETGSTTENRSLIWIPENQSEINLVNIAGGLTAEEQWDKLETFIEADEYLSANRGSYAAKNGARAPMISQLDVRIAQSFVIKTGGKANRFEVSFDVFNFANLLNPEWGVVYNNPFAYPLINFVGYESDGTTPRFTFTDSRLGDERFSIDDRLSRWRGRLGIRYIFN